MPFHRMPNFQKGVLVAITVLITASFGIGSAIFYLGASSDPTVARLGGKDITEQQLHNRSRALSLVYGSERQLAKFGDPVYQTLQRDREGGRDAQQAQNVAVNHMAQAHLARASGIRVSREDLARHMEELFEKAGGREELKKLLREAVVEESAFVDGVRERMAIDLLLSFVVEHLLKLDYQDAFNSLRERERKYKARLVRLTLEDLLRRGLPAATIAGALQRTYGNAKEKFETPPAAHFEVVWSSEAAFREAAERDLRDRDLREHLKANRAAVLKAIGEAGLAPEDRARRELQEGGKKGSWDSGSPGRSKKPEQMSDLELLEEYRDLLVSRVAGERAARQVKAAWDGLEAALAKDPRRPLKALAQTLGLQHLRSAGFLTREQLERLTPATDKGLAAQALETVPVGGVGPATSERAGFRYRVKVLERRALALRPFSAVSQEEILRAAHAKNEERFKTAPAYDVERVRVVYSRWTRPPALSTQELEKFYEAHRERLFKDAAGKVRPLAEVRPAVERLLAAGGEAKAAGDLLGELQEKASQASTPPRGQRAPAGRPDLVMNRYELAKAARERGLEYERMSVEEGKLKDGPLAALAGRRGREGQEQSELAKQEPGWVSQVVREGGEQYFVRLLAREAPRTKPFEQVREQVLRLVLEVELKDRLGKEAEALRASLIKDFAAGAAQHGLEVLAWDRVAGEEDLAPVPPDERALVLAQIKGQKDKVGQIGNVIFDKDRDVAYVLQVTAVSVPAEDEIRSFAIEQAAREALFEIWNNHVQRDWFSSTWYTRYNAMEMLPQPRRKPGQDDRDTDPTPPVDPGK